MKRNSLYKGLVVSVALSAMLTACGSNTDSSKSGGGGDKTTTINGKAVDGYLQYATVCLDLNGDGYCQEIEPSTQTKVDGSFELQIKAQIKESKEYDEAMLLVYGGKDVDTGKDFIGKLMAPKDSQSVVVTPITTIVAKKVASEIKDKKLSKEEIEKKVKEAKEKVANSFGIEVADLDKDPVAYKDTNPKLIKEALKLQKSLEAIDSNPDKEDIDRYYAKLAEHIDDAQGLDDLLSKSFKDDSKLSKKLEKVKRLNKNIDELIDKKLPLDRVAFIVKDDIKKIRDDQEIDEVDISTLPKSDDEWKKKFIKSDLKDIGVDIDDEELEKLKDKVNEVRPGAIFKDYKKLDESDEFEKKIKSKIELKDEYEKAKKSNNHISFKEGVKFYGLHHDSYEEISVDDGKVLERDFILKNGEFVEDSDDSDVKFVLESGEWKEVNENGPFEYEIKDGELIIPSQSMKVSIVSQKDISGKEIYIKEIDDLVKMPEGAKMSFIKVEAYKSDKSYKLFGEAEFKDVANLDELREKLYNKDKWKIESVDGVDILVNIEYEEIYSFVGDKVYRGYIEHTNEGESEFDISYNSVAMEVIKPLLKEKNSKKQYPANVVKVQKIQKPKPAIVTKKKREQEEIKKFTFKTVTIK